MALDVLAAGKLVKDPERRTARNGNAYALAQLSVAMGDEGDMLASCIAFGAEPVAALLALDKGDTCVVAGRGKVGTWTNRDGDARPSLSITVDAVLSAYHVQRKRRAVAGDDRAPDDPAPSPRADRGATRLHASRALPALEAATAGGGIDALENDPLA